MKPLPAWLLLLGFVALAAFWLTGLSNLPFHPDEVSLLFQSRDFETFINNPISLSYSADLPLTQTMEYRALNAPLAKYVIAIGRRLNGVSADQVNVDWDWQADWSMNLVRGALPPAKALIGGRMMSSLMALLAVPLLFWAGSLLGGSKHGLAASALFGFNGLVLLHGRRAMAEGTLLFTIALLIPLAFLSQRRPLLAGLAAGLSFCAKHSALPLLAMPLSALILQDITKRHDDKTWQKYGLLVVGFFLVVAALNPFAWRNPLEAVRISINARRSFVLEQTALTDELAEGAVLDTTEERIASMLGNTFLLPLQFQEVGNYQRQLSESIDDYTQTIGHNLLIGPIQGSLLLGLTLLGFWGGLRAAPFSPKARGRRHLILATGTISMGAALVLFNPLPYQRYYTPLLPLLSLWQASGLLTLADGVRILIRKRSGG